VDMSTSPRKAAVMATDTRTQIPELATRFPCNRPDRGDVVARTTRQVLEWVDVFTLAGTTFHLQVMGVFEINDDKIKAAGLLRPEPIHQPDGQD
jgi:hypothetical protein